jgi:hypothetical protein
MSAPTKGTIVAKATPAGTAGAVNLLGPDGKNYTLFYLARGGKNPEWQPVKFVENFPK